MTKKPRTTDIKAKTVAAALVLAAEQGWSQTGLAAIARRARVPLADLRDHFDDRIDILAAYGRIVDKKTLAAAANDETMSRRDRLFDLLMARFDVLNEDRAGVCAVLNSFRCDPKQAVISLPHLGRSMCWMLEAAGIDTGGVKGAVAVAGLTGLYLKTLRTWMDDDSQDMSKTMAALDKNLASAEQWATAFIFQA